MGDLGQSEENSKKGCQTGKQGKQSHVAGRTKGGTFLPLRQKPPAQKVHPEQWRKAG